MNSQHLSNHHHSKILTKKNYQYGKGGLLKKKKIKPEDYICSKHPSEISKPYEILDKINKYSFDDHSSDDGNIINIFNTNAQLITSIKKCYLKKRSYF